MRWRGDYLFLRLDIFVLLGVAVLLAAAYVVRRIVE
jgi:hypothetical protein